MCVFGMIHAAFGATFGIVVSLIRFFKALKNYSVISSLLVT